MKIFVWIIFNCATLATLWLPVVLSWLLKWLEKFPVSLKNLWTALFTKNKSVYYPHSWQISCISYFYLGKILFYKVVTSMQFSCDSHAFGILLTHADPMSTLGNKMKIACQLHGSHIFYTSTEKSCDLLSWTRFVGVTIKLHVDCMSIIYQMHADTWETDEHCHAFGMGSAAHKIAHNSSHMCRYCCSIQNSYARTQHNSNTIAISPPQLFCTTNNSFSIVSKLYYSAFPHFKMFRT
jgi:hypothetical protein